MKGIFERFKQNGFLSVSVIYIISSFIVKGISFITTPVFTRLMGSADFGIVSNFTTWEQVLSTFICFQVSSGLLPAKVNHAPDRFKNYMKNVVTCASLCALGVSVILIVFGKPIGQFTKLGAAYIPLLCVSSFGIAATNICSSYYIATNKPKQKVVFSISVSLITVILGLLLVYFMPNKSQGRIFGYTIAYSLMIVFCLFKFLRQPFDSKENFKKDIRYALAFGLPLIPHLLANSINGNADRIFIINICGESQNGIYSVAYSLGQIALVFAAACSDAWNPWYFAETKKKTKTADREIQKYYTFYTLTIAMCFVGVMMLSPELFKLMAPEEYWSGIPCVLYVAVGVFFLFIYRFPLSYEQFNSNTKYVAPATIISALVNVGLNSVLIPRLGINGAALATTISYVVLWGVHEVVARKIIKGYNISLKSSCYAIVLVLAVFGSSLFLINYGLLIRAAILAVLCAGYALYVYCNVIKVKGDKSND